MDTPDSHKELVSRCLRNDRKSQKLLYGMYADGMYNVCLRMLRNAWDAEDVLQGVFVDVFSKLDTYRFESTLGAWIKQITIHHCINFLHKRKLGFEELSDSMPVPAVEETESGETEAYQVEKIKKAVDMLPDGYRVVFNLYMFEGYDHDEISQILNISESTSKSQFSRAKQKIKDLMVQV